MKPRIFLGSSGKQAKLLEALTRGLSEIAVVEPWTTVFNPGVSTLDRLVELTHEVDFAAFVFAQDDFTTNPTDDAKPGQASPRDNVVFEAGLFGGALGMRRTFILHANGAKLPTDLLGMTAVRYPPEPTASDVRGVVQKLVKAIEDEGRRASIEGYWWQHSLTERTLDPSAVSLLRIARDRDGSLTVTGEAWAEDGTLTTRYWSVATKEHHDPSAVLYFWQGERPRLADAPRYEGVGEIKIESTDRARGYWVTKSESDPLLNARTSGIYLRADPGDMQVLESSPDARIALIGMRISEWRAIAQS